MREQISLNDKWEFCEEFTDAVLKAGKLKDTKEVRIPHTVKELPYHYFDDALYQMVSGYRRVIHADKSWEGKRIFVKFMAVAHTATVYLNGEQICEHRCGYTAFEFDITEYVKFDAQNCLVVKLDSRESLNIPPFGFVIDYMTYGGIYRDVYLEISDKTYVEDAKKMIALAKYKVEKEGCSDTVCQWELGDLDISNEIVKGPYGYEYIRSSSPQTNNQTSYVLYYIAYLKNFQVFLYNF